MEFLFDLSTDYEILLENFEFSSNCFEQFLLYFPLLSESDLSQFIVILLTNVKKIINIIDYQICMNKLCKFEKFFGIL